MAETINHASKGGTAMTDPRNGIVDFVEKEFIGPDCVHLQENGEEFLVGDVPTIRYLSGILYEQEDRARDSDVLDSSAEDSNESGDSGEVGSVDSDIGSEDDWLELSNTTKPSAISLSFVMSEADTITVNVSAATYSPAKDAVLGQGFARQPLAFTTPEITLDYIKKHRGESISIHKAEGKTDLQLSFFFRGPTSDKRLSLVTVSLINANVLVKTKDNSQHDYRKCFFQVGFTINNSSGFHPIPSKEKVYHDEDSDNNDLLYRDVKSFAAGHGCSPLWDDRSAIVSKIETSFFPRYFNKPIVPSTLPGVDLNMLAFSKEGTREETFLALGLLCDKYGEWIHGLEKQTLIRKQYPAADRNITACKDCLGRMRKGLGAIQTNELAYQAFRYMNEAMLSQQLHYKLPILDWDASGSLIIPPDYRMPNLDDDSTWYHKNENVYGQWRPFQIAFILVNILSTVDPKSSERNFVDLIWFPTGGGKTEAYLGLSAFTIFWERLNEKDNNFGISVLMRYTLRLLTSQQYERATALICSCEDIRTRNEEALGKKPISIGLFVGGATSPNTFSDASKKYDDLFINTNGNPFVVVKCPWCGAKMGPVRDRGKNRVYGYHRQKITKTKSVFYYQCDNPDCKFHHEKLPLSVIDEDIYENPPTLLIGTVDKFAMLVFNHRSQRLFGFDDGVKKGNPSLIIQDELHLISGPLGSMVAAYETMIDELMKDKRNGETIAPKIIASTATIARARDQCHNLFDVPKDAVKIFPPSGFSAGDSFFAEEKAGGTGREYVGVYAPGAPSVSTASIRLYAALFEAPLHESFSSLNEKDAYWTTVGYYNSLRELGKAATWISSDIPEHCKTIYSRYPKDTDYRWPGDINFRELTSRKNSKEVADNLHMLETSLPNKDAVDVCFATSMISVGLDVQRLGLMTVAGQPKTTAEYIQATSRVGRDSKRPGLIFVVYNSFKPRDKSIFESFQAFHSRFYSFVEPTSISVFSPQIRRQAMPAILIGTAFLKATDTQATIPASLLLSGKVEEAEKAILERVSDLDPEEVEDAQKQMDSIIRTWGKIGYHVFAYPFTETNDYTNTDKYAQIPLIYPKGSVPQEKWIINSNAVATSMRDVDKECNIRIWNAD